MSKYIVKINFHIQLCVYSCGRLRYTYVHHILYWIVNTKYNSNADWKKLRKKCWRKHVYAMCINDIDSCYIHTDRFRVHNWRKYVHFKNICFFVCKIRYSVRPHINFAFSVLYFVQFNWTVLKVFFSHVRVSCVQTCSALYDKICQCNRFNVMKFLLAISKINNRIWIHTLRYSSFGIMYSSCIHILKYFFGSSLNCSLMRSNCFVVDKLCILPNAYTQYTCETFLASCFRLTSLAR